MQRFRVILNDADDMNYEKAYVAVADDP